ncbi:hypothetical protein DL770_003625 [Monosporascus sp. CRB-9-2]|nr:hypothetical protein DL770_003625 [Monosporascus sp. CRB-9-2]
MLHCIAVLYQLNDPEFYGVRLGLVPQDINADLCVNKLRQYIMCHAPDGPVAFVWREDTPRPYPSLGMTETCVDRDYYDKWVRECGLSVESMTTMDEDGEFLFEHPKFGNVTIEMYTNVAKGVSGIPSS